MYLQPKQRWPHSPRRLKAPDKPDREPPRGGLDGDEKDEGRQCFKSVKVTLEVAHSSEELHHPASPDVQKLVSFPPSRWSQAGFFLFSASWTERRPSPQPLTRINLSPP